jgi:uridine phosphorylase
MVLTSSRVPSSLTTNTSRGPGCPGSIKAMGMCVALAERYSNAFLEYSKLEELEIQGGTAALRALVHVPLDPPAPAITSGAEVASEREVQYVWE